jgi:hypothetical protein
MVSAIADSRESAGGQFFAERNAAGLQGVIQLSASGTPLHEFNDVFDNLNGSSNAAEVLLLS